MSRVSVGIRAFGQALRDHSVARRGAGYQPFVETLESRELMTVGGKISGIVFNDAITNGVQDAGELALAGVTVFVDRNANGMLDAGEVSAKTGPDGSYTLNLPQDGAFQVRQLEPQGFVQSSVDPAPVPVAGGAAVGNINFGDRRTLPPDQSFVDQAFRDHLGRGADAGAVTFFGNALDQGTIERSQVDAAIESSTEFRSKQLDTLFTQLLHRSADPGAKAAFLDAFAKGASSAQIEATILASAEYFQLRGGGSNTGFATALFQDVLGRTIDANGLKFAQGFLAAGGSRLLLNQVVEGSQESGAHEVQGLFQQLLHRNADAGALSGFTSAFSSGASAEQVAAAIAGSDEYFQRFCL